MSCNINNFRWNIIAAMGLLFFLVNVGLFPAEGAVTRRFGIFIGSNNGGMNRVLLRYAESDARAIARVFTSMGGIADEDSVLLIEPTVSEINNQLTHLERLSSQARRNAQRTELIFYYSGHSDEDGIFLNTEHYGYRELREHINTVQTDMRIVILDSCSSGAITRAKGGVKSQPFLLDDSVSVEGYAFLASSAANETSQESDSIESSYFTHSLIAGLRGAADSVGDRRVTLNELYRFAYTETLAKTETSVFGTQHPSYDIQISGAGDVVLTDIREISASMLISEDVLGRISIRDGSGFLTVELTKNNHKSIELGLESGSYRLTLLQGNNFYQGELILSENKQTSLSMRNFSAIAGTSGNRTRGNNPFEDYNSLSNTPVYPANLQFLPGFNVFRSGKEEVTNNFLFGLFGGMGDNIKGLGLASLALINPGYVQGAQISGFYNYAGGGVRGIQASVGSNMAGELKGLQIGLVNINESGSGGMIGLVNKSDSEYIIPLGLVNIIRNGIIHGSLYYDDMQFINAGFRSGSKYFYSFISFGLGTNYSFSRLGTEREGRSIPLGARLGIGVEYPINAFFIDFDGSAGALYVPGTTKYGYDDELASYLVPAGQLRLIGGYKIVEHMGIFAGLTYSVYNLPLIPDKRANDYNVKSGDYYSYKWGFVTGIQF